MQLTKSGVKGQAEDAVFQPVPFGTLIKHISHSRYKVGYNGSGRTIHMNHVSGGTIIDQGSGVYVSMEPKPESTVSKNSGTTRKIWVSANILII